MERSAKVPPILPTINSVSRSDVSGGGGGISSSASGDVKVSIKSPSTLSPVKEEAKPLAQFKSKPSLRTVAIGTMAAGKVNNFNNNTSNPPTAFRKVTSSTEQPKVLATGAETKTASNGRTDEKINGASDTDAPVVPRAVKPNIAEVLARDKYNATRHRHIENLTAEMDAEEVQQDKQGSNKQGRNVSKKKDVDVGTTTLKMPVQASNKVLNRSTTSELAQVMDLDETPPTSPHGADDMEDDLGSDDEDEHGAWELVAVRTALSIAIQSPNNRGYKDNVRKVTIEEGPIGLTFSSFAILPEDERQQAEKLGGHAGVVSQYICF